MSANLISSIPTNLYIGGEWLPSSDGNRISVVDPATELVIADVASGSAADATGAVDAAFEAAAEWAATPPRVRGEVLRKAFELMTEMPFLLSVTAMLSGYTAIYRRGLRPAEGEAAGNEHKCGTGD